MYASKCLIVLFLCSSYAFSESKLSVFEANFDIVPVIAKEPVLELYVTLSEKIHVGKTDDGERFIVPITGGHFQGQHGLRGSVMPGGADWQVQRSDGVKDITAIYSIQADDGTVIVVDNRGIATQKNGARYAHTVPKFHAPVGKHDWLNKRMFSGTITRVSKDSEEKNDSVEEPNGRAVIIRVYEVQ